METNPGNNYREKVYRFYEALAMKNIGTIEDLFTNESRLFWGPYEFIGKEAIVDWALGLFELFPFMSFKEKNLSINGSEAKHEFMIAFLTSQGRKGWLPCEAEYVFNNDDIKQLKFKLLHGFLAVSKDEVERVKPQGSSL